MLVSLLKRGREVVGERLKKTYITTQTENAPSAVGPSYALLKQISYYTLQNVI